MLARTLAQEADLLLLDDRSTPWTWKRCSGHLGGCAAQPGRADRHRGGRTEEFDGALYLTKAAVQPPPGLPASTWVLSTMHNRPLVASTNSATSHLPASVKV
ncbi:MAG: hypothetical protein R2911_25485 [Caldilineaceae bacterium]